MTTTLKHSTSPLVLSAEALRSRDRTCVELALLPHLLVLMIEEIGKQGWDVRSDVFVHLNRAAAVPLKDLDQFSVSRLAKRVDDVARSLLADVAPGDGPDGLAAIAFLIMKLVDEGLFPDVRNQAVTVALLLIEDMRADDSEWAVRELTAKGRAGSMLHRLQLQGLFLPRKAPVLPQPASA